MSVEPASAFANSKFKLIQALRGIAAMWVVLHHAYWGRHVVDLYAALPPELAQTLFLRGFFGVEIFFVLSGFIIAHSVRGAEITARYVRDFALRRSVRLDPPYWAAIAFVVTMATLSARVVHKPYTPPTFLNVLAHLSYTQVILGFPEISGVFWTLAYEVQFYLILVLSLLIFQKLSRRLNRVVAALAVFSPLYIIAWIWGVFIHGDNSVGFFYINWYGFFVGALGYWAASKRYVLVPFLALAAGLFLFGPDVAKVCAVTAVLLHITQRNGSIVWALSWRPLQFLGSISYSLYLIHTPIQGASMFLLYRWIPRTAVGEAAALTLSVLTCVFGAFLFWWAIERPSHSLAKRIGRQAKLGRLRARLPENDVAQEGDGR